MDKGQKRATPPAAWAAWLCRPGGLVFLVFLFQAAAGMFLVFFYLPSPANAWESIEFIENDVPLGAFFRSLHRWGAFVLALFLCLHILLQMFRGAWRRRGLAWWTGILLFLLVAAFTLTGYLLPWDFRSYWTVKTIGNWLDRLPAFAGAAQWLLFADTPGGVVPVGRWFALHILVLPLLAGICFCGHFLLARGLGFGELRQEGGSSGGGERVAEKKAPLRRCARAAAAVAGTALLLCGLAAFGIQRQDIADPITTSAIPQPDWLFLVFFQVTRYFQSDMEMVGVFWIPALLLAGALLLPLADRGARRKKWLRQAFFPLSLAVFLAVAVVTFHTGSTTPVWSCASCHKKGFGQAFANAPKTVDAFSSRYDNKWLALHYRYPQYFWMMDADVPAW
ncbi:MAG: cytochrome b N-terminal domain-containing protein [Desulfovibrio sp.]|jgi:quinol-cytochrome oxidoreductase complex cytochrome b subunit|nr:cytochrome b N-terminal domain-containing protein [Desulfovibrio sp.]